MVNRSFALLAALVALAVGFGAGLVVGGGGGDAPREARAPAHGRAATASSPGVQETGAPLAPPGARAERSEPRVPSAGDLVAAARRDVADAERAGAAEPAGTGVIRGLVVDDRRRPMAGATVVAIHRPGRAPGEVWYDTRGPVGRGWDNGEPRARDLEDYVRDRIEGDARIRTTASDDAGTFVIDGLPRGAYQLRAYREGFEGEASIVLTGDEVTLALGRIGAYTLDPRLPDGSQPDEAAVVVDVERGSRQVHRWSADNPVLRLPLRAARITMHSADIQEVTYNEFMSSFTSVPRTVDLDHDGPGPHVFNLVPRTGLAVRLRPTGLIDGSQRFAVEVSARASDAWVALERNDDLHYATAGATPGPNLVRVMTQAGEELTEVPVELETGLNDIEVSLEGPDESEFLVIVCVEEDGDPVEVESLHYSASVAAGSRSGIVRPLIREGGEHWVEWSRFNADVSEIESVTLKVHSDLYGDIERTIEAGARRVEIILLRPCEMTIQVNGLPPGTDGAAFAEFVDESEAAKKRRSRSRSGLTGDVPPDGLVRLGAVQPGTYDVAVETYWGNGNENTVVERRVEVSGKAMTVELTVPPLYDVEVVVAGAGKARRASILADDRSPHPYFQMAESDDGGLVTFEAVPAGHYRITANPGGGDREMLITVPCGRVEFVPSEITGYLVRHVRDGSIAAGMGFEVGDVIVGSPDEPIDGEAALHRILARALEAPVVLRVERGGGEARLVLPKSKNGAPYTSSNFGLWVEARLE